MTTADGLEGVPVRILHVEDNEAHAELVRRGFEDHRIANEIEHVMTGEAALTRLEECLQTEGGLPDVVLLDLRLPGIDGLEVLTAIRDTDGLESLPVVILTTSEAEWDRLKAYERHMNGYIVKPFDFDSFAVLLDVITLLMRDKKTARTA
jgi:chemotaxis family two-component system response regulator Rcp1